MAAESAAVCACSGAVYGAAESRAVAATMPRRFRIIGWKLLGGRRTGARVRQCVPARTVVRREAKPRLGSFPSGGDDTAGRGDDAARRGEDQPARRRRFAL